MKRNETNMGIERSVTLWCLHSQMLLLELASLEAQLLHIRTTLRSGEAQPEVGMGAAEEGSCAPPAEIERQYKRVQERLRNLGPCPKPLMG